MESILIKIAGEVGERLIPQVLKVASRVFHNRFRRGIASLRGFEDGQTSIVLSSLYPTSLVNTTFKPIEAISRTQVRGISVLAPVPFTGIRDSFGLARLTAELVKSEIDFELRIDPISDQEKANSNLILLGSPTSNLVAREFYHRYLPPTARFSYDTQYAQMMYDRTPYQGGDFGVALKYRNPWNEERQLLWLAGLGPAGTEASALFVIQEFDTQAVPQEIQRNPYWITIIQAQITDDYVTGANFRGGRRLV